MLAVGVSVLLFAAIIVGVTNDLRERLRDEITGRSAAILQGILQIEFTGAGREPQPGHVEQADLMAILARVSRLDGVLAVRLYRADGTLVDSLPAAQTRRELSAARLEAATLRQSTLYDADANPGDYSIPAADDGEDHRPLLDILLPIRAPEGGELVAVAQFIVDGSSVEASLDELHGELAEHMLTALLLGVGVGGGLISWAFWRLQRANRLLIRRARKLAEWIH